MALSIQRLTLVKERTGLSRSSIYSGVKNGTFPSPVAVGRRAVGWLSDDIDNWIATRTRVSHAKKYQSE